eukprot:2086557-Prymnesium_polylepis.1
MCTGQDAGPPLRVPFASCDPTGWYHSRAGRGAACARGRCIEGRASASGLATHSSGRAPKGRAASHS